MSDFPKDFGNAGLGIGMNAVPFAYDNYWIRSMFGTYQGGVGWAAFGPNVVIASPIALPAGYGIDEIGLNIEAVGSAGSTIRMGVWDVSNYNLPGRLLASAAPVPGTVLGLSTVSISRVTGSRGAVFVGAVAQGSPVTEPTVSAFQGWGVGAPTLSALNFTGFAYGGVTGALPAEFTSDPAISFPYNTAPIMYARLAR